MRSNLIHVQAMLVIIVALAPLLGGCEITFKKVITVSVIDKATNLPASNTHVRVAYEMNILGPSATEALTDQDGKACIRLSSSDDSWLVIGDLDDQNVKSGLFDLDKAIIKRGGVLRPSTGAEHQNFVVSIKPGCDKNLATQPARHD